MWMCPINMLAMAYSGIDGQSRYHVHPCAICNGVSKTTLASRKEMAARLILRSVVLNAATITEGTS
jgi:hypothetical protein